MLNRYKDILTVEELCEVLKIGKNTAYTLLKSGEIKSVKIGRVYMEIKTNKQKNAEENKILFSSAFIFLLLLHIFYINYYKEMFYDEKFESVNAFIDELKRYIDYYNNERISIKLKGMSPVQYRTHSRAILY